MDGESLARIEQIEDIIGYRFTDRSLLERAFVHSSVASCRLESNERLEFLGDSVLGLVACQRIFDLYPDLLEGDMTKIKSAAVSRRTCAKLARSLGLQKLLVVGKGMMGQTALPQSLSAAVLEAVVGALTLDGGLKAARRFLLPLLDPVIEAAAESGHQHNFKSVLQQHAQQQLERSPGYRTLDEKGPDHSKCFKVCVEIGERQFDAVWGQSKKEAEQHAALIALIELGLAQLCDNGDVQVFG
ncbi:MAG: ribonuclease III [Planctomycetota bacterium]|nr:MAG: ribonuclease III [Planctomycetota bacterium]